MEIFGRWQLEAPIKIVHVRGYGFWRGFGWTWRGWPLRRIRWFYYAPLNNTKRDTEQEGQS